MEREHAHAPAVEAIQEEHEDQAVPDQAAAEAEAKAEAENLFGRMQKGKQVSEPVNAEPTQEEKATLAQAEAIYDEQVRQQGGSVEMVQVSAKLPAKK